ncbi:MAG: 2-C-methyl-D-erythritol 4-phosphate cytidylyltransferase [Chlamydiae bacterium]|nr:2-C-methyl-D-erythritol 4-phosphate cytidylyltransferase [Chlamydiota bacterium]
MTNYISALLLAGGTGSRFGEAIPKQFCTFKSKKIAHYSLDLLLACDQISEVIIVCDIEQRNQFSDYASEKIRFANPGKTRQGSVAEGLLQTSPNADFVCIHDSARPLLTEELLHSVLAYGITYGAAALATPAKNTIKEVDSLGFVKKTLDRSTLWEMQTPQVLSTDLLRKGMAYAEKTKIIATDDVALAELLGIPTKIVPSSERNIKITTPDDLIIALALWEEMHAEV